MTYENAMRWYHFDPFTHITKEQATVGALRKAAEGHDVTIQALSQARARRRQLRRLRGQCQGNDRQQGLSPERFRRAWYASATDVDARADCAVPRLHEERTRVPGV